MSRRRSGGRSKRRNTKVGSELIAALIFVCASCAEPTLAPTAQDPTPNVAGSVTLSPRQAEVLVGQTLQLNAELTDASGAAVAGSVTWTTTGGSVDENGEYQAPLESGTHYVVAHAADGGADTATVTSLLLLNGFEAIEDVEDAEWSSETCCAYSTQVTTTQVREGGSAVRFEVRRSDPQVNLGVRSELSLPLSGVTGGIGDERWYGFSIFVPETWTSESRLGEALVQWHAQPDFHLGEGWRSPPLMIMVQGDSWSVVNRSDPREVTNSAVSKRTGRVLWTGDLVPGTWTDWVVHAKWSYEADGVLEVWKDGETIVAGTGPNTYNDVKPLYFKMGIYSWEWKTAIQTPITERIAVHDAVRISGRGGSYDAVAPRGEAAR